MSEKRLVIAGNYAQYQRFLAVDIPEIEGVLRTAIRKNAGIHPRNHYKYCHRFEDLCGYHRGVQVLYTGEYWNNPLYGSAQLLAIDPNPPRKTLFKGQPLDIETWMQEIYHNILTEAELNKLLATVSPALGKPVEKIVSVKSISDSIILDVKLEP